MKNNSYYSKEELELKLKATLKNFIEKDGILLKIGSSERSLTHKFAEHLQKAFNDWDVDCEYNRDEINIKKLPFNSEKKPVFPDIIIHKRCEDNNLLVIEAKKSNTNNNSIKYDLYKLNKYLSNFNYMYGLFICFDSKSESGYNTFKLKENGKKF